MNLHHYIINDKGEISTVDLMTWARWLESEQGSRDKQIGNTQLPEVRVSTVFLGLDHNFGGGKPILFETMVFENRTTQIDLQGKPYSTHKPIEDYSNRYHTLEEAKKGHEGIVRLCEQEKTFWHCEICGEARPNSKISVHTYPLKDLPGGERNVRYCNDKDCLDGAIEKSLTQQI